MDKNIIYSSGEITIPSSITKQGLKTNLYINDEGEVDGLKETPKPKEE